MTWQLRKKTSGIHLTQWEACLWAFGLLTFIRHFKTDHILENNSIYTKITIKSESKRKWKFEKLKSTDKVKFWILVCKFYILMTLARSTKNHPLHLLEHSQGCWAGHHPCLEFVQWTLSWGKPIWGFTPVCTVAKGLEVAIASQHLSMSQNYQTQTFTSTEASWLIITSQCYIKQVSA